MLSQVIHFFGNAKILLGLSEQANTDMPEECKIDALMPKLFSQIFTKRAQRAAVARAGRCNAYLMTIIQVSLRFLFCLLGIVFNKRWLQTIVKPDWVLQRKWVKPME